MIPNETINTSPAEGKRKAPVGTYILASLITAYLMFFTVVPNEGTAFAALALIIAFCFAFLRSVPAGLLVTIPTVFLFTSGTSLVQVATVASVIFIIGLGGAAMLHVKAYILVPLGVASYAASLIFTKDPLVSAIMLLYVPGAILSAVLLHRGVRRVTRICSVSAIVLVAICAPVAVSVAIEYGGLSEKILFAFIDDVRAAFTEACMAGAESYKDALESVTAIDQLESVEKMMSLMNEEFFRLVFDMILCLLPALLIVSTNLISFLSDILTLSLCRIGDYRKKLPGKAVIFSMSPVSAILFIIAVIVPLLGLGNSNLATLITLVINNLSLILMPAFLFVGFCSVYRFFREQKGCLNIWVILAIIFFAMYAGGMLIYPLAFIGAFSTLRRRRDPLS